MRGQMSGGDWKPFENESRVRGAEGGDDKNWFRLCSFLTSASRLQLVDTPPLLGLFRTQPARQTGCERERGEAGKNIGMDHCSCGH